VKMAGARGKGVCLGKLQGWAGAIGEKEFGPWAKDAFRRVQGRAREI
jgi:hypothetical protein